MEINSSFKPVDKGREHHLISLDNSDIFGRTTSLFSTTIKSNVKSTRRAKYLTAIVHLGNYKRLREALMFLNCLSFSLCFLNYELQYPLLQSPPSSSIAGLIVGIFVHVCTCIVYCWAIYSYNRALSSLSVSNTHLSRLHFCKQVIGGGLLYLICPLPGIRENTMVFPNRYTATDGKTYLYKIDFCALLFMADLTISLASFFYFWFEVQQKLTVQKIQMNYRFGENVGFVQGSKKFLATSNFWILLAMLTVWTCYLGGIVRFSEGLFQTWQQHTSSYSAPFDSQVSINQLMALGAYSNSVWAATLTMTGVAAPDFPYQSYMTMAIMGGWVVIGCLLLRLLPTLWSVASFSGTEDQQYGDLQALKKANQAHSAAAADFIKVFFFRFFVYRTSGNPERLRDVENQLQTACIRFRQAKATLVIAKKASKTERILPEARKMKSKLLLVDHLIEVLGKKRVERPRTNH
jgi:hypothetical protein